MNMGKEKSVSAYIKGTCKFMCPEKELKMREQEGLIHVLELPPGTKLHKHTRADHNLMVKCFSRSAAGQHSNKPDDLRPPEVLYKTVCHLLTNIAERKDVSWNVVYDFIFDRLRAVRQDIVIQNLIAQQCIKILEPIVRFHAYSGYRLCEEPLSRFDPVINRTHLLECLQRILVSYDMTQTSVTSSCHGNKALKDKKENQMAKKGFTTRSLLFSTSLGTEIYDKQKIKLEGRIEMEAVYLLATMGDYDALNRTLNLKGDRNDVILKIAFSMSLAARCGNYVRACRLLLYLPPLLACIAAQQLPSLRRHALQIMSVAYSSRNLTYPLCKLQTLLLYPSTDQTVKDCATCGVFVKDESITFAKDSFNPNGEMNNFIRVEYVERLLKSIHLSQLFFSSSQHYVLT